MVIGVNFSCRDIPIDEMRGEKGFRNKAVTKFRGLSPNGERRSPVFLSYIIQMIIRNIETQLGKK